MKKPFLVFIFLLLIGFNSTLISQNFLNKNLNSNWTFKSTTDTNWLPATVPGSVHTDLLANNIIEDPYYRLNEYNLQWIDKNDWEYRTYFSIDSSTIVYDVVEISFEGLDTYAKVYLNNQLILDADNMFMYWEIDCKDKLVIGENTMRIVFKSPIVTGLGLRENLGYFLPGAENDQSELGGVGDKKTCVFTRKAQYHYGWDWGPRLVTSGIWQDIELKAWNNYKIVDINIIQDEITENEAIITSEIEMKSVKDENVNIIAMIDSITVAEKKVHLTVGINKISILFTISNPELWWTNGLGNQKLYDIEFQVANESGFLSSKNQNIGLRTVELVQEVDSIGKSFYFKLNGHPVFMKGANYIPQDVFLSRVSNQDYENLIKSAVDANINMLRVWGGGIYEKDIFYNLCDKYGILIWQDFMFACAMYPGNKAFVENVKMEAIQNVKRLRNHPSIALWCGNNEILSAWNRWGWKEDVLENQGQDIVDTIWKAYENVFHNILPSVVAEYNPQRLYWSSSPSIGFGELENGKSGDSHYWGVWWAKEPFSKYKEEIPRFMSEYGFQSFPELNSVKKYALEEDWDINAEVMKSHQRSSIGNVTIEEYMKRDYRDPKDFPMFLYVNHVLQAEGIKTAIEAHRLNMPYCMGSLYWQLNDCWPVASWSGIDYYGNWKAMHYFVKKAFSSILVVPDADSNNHISVSIVSDKMKNVSAILSISIIDFEGQFLFEIKENITILANSSHAYFNMNLDSLKLDINKKQILLNAEVFDNNNNNELLSNNVYYFNNVKNLNLPKPEITYEINEMSGYFIITLRTKRLAKNLYLRIDKIEGKFSANYFDLLPGNNTEVIFTPKNPIGLTNFKENLKIFTIRDTY